MNYFWIFKCKPQIGVSFLSFYQSAFVYINNNK